MDGALVQEHLNHFNSLISKFKSLDVKSDDEKKASILPYSISDSWDNLIMNVSYVKSLKMESIIASFLTEDLRCKSC